MLTKRRGVALVAVLSLVVAFGSSLKAAEPSDDTRLAARQRLVKERFQSLLKDMYTLADLLEKTEPENAARLKEAMKAAQESLVQSNMEKLIRTLRESKLGGAKQDAKDVLDSLARILKILTSEEAGLEDGFRELERLRKLEEQITKLLEAETGALAKSRLVTAAQKALGDLAALSRKLEELIKEQDKNLNATGQLAAGKGGKAEQNAAAGKQDKLTSDAKKLGDALKGIAKALKAAAAAGTGAGEGGGEGGGQGGGEGGGKGGGEGGGEGGGKGGGKGGGNSGAPGAKQAGNAANKVQDAGKQMAGAADNLKKGDPKAAEPKEKKALDDLNQAKKELDDLKRELEELVKKTKAAEQQKEQAGIRKEAERVAKGGGKGGGQGGGKGGGKGGGQGGGEGGGEQSETEKEARDEVGKAAQDMQKAENGLARKDRQAAGDHQQRAVERLRRARQGVQQQAQQLGPQLQEDLLAQLEALLRKMLNAQRAVTAETIKVHADITKNNARLTRKHELALKALSTRERGIAKDASKAQSMLEADGSTIVMLSEMEDTRELMLNVAKLLQEFGCGLHTQGLEKDVEKALEDMIMAIQKERKRRDEEEQQGGGQGGGQGQGQQQPLIPLSAELKMLKALQLRINYRTVGLQAARPKMKPHTLHQQAAALAKRQGRVGTLTRELSAKIRADRAAHGGGGGF